VRLDHFFLGAAACGDVERKNYRLQDIQLSAFARVASFGETGFARPVL
jgi:hypothetical protein